MTETSREIRIEAASEARSRAGSQPKTLRNEGGLCLVRSIGSGCRIYRDMVGRYVVLHADDPAERRPVATLAGAYAACRGWEQRAGNGLGG